jgi:hypothetical protein
MDLKKMSADKQVKSLKSLLRSGEKTATSHIAVSAFKHSLIKKEHGDTALKPVLRWYLGQLAKEFIKKHFKEAKETLENFAKISLIEIKHDQGKFPEEFHLNEALFPALNEALEDVYGKEYIGKVVSGVKYFRPPGSGEKQNYASK